MPYYTILSDGAKSLVQVWETVPFDYMKNVTPGRRQHRPMTWSQFWLWAKLRFKTIPWERVRRYFFWQAILILIILYVLFKPKTDWYHYNRSRWNG